LREDCASRKPAASLRLLGPAEAPLFKLKNFYRYHFQLQSNSSAALHDVLKQGLGKIKTPKGVDLSVDVDPLSML
jgi:primosomal protein N' (replication factor Y)